MNFDSYAFVENGDEVLYSKVVAHSVDYFAGNVINSSSSTAKYKALAKQLVVYGDSALNYFLNK